MLDRAKKAAASIPSAIFEDLNLPRKYVEIGKELFEGKIELEDIEIEPEPEPEPDPDPTPEPDHEVEMEMEMGEM